MQPPLLQEILKLYPSLAPAERRVADVILRQPQAVIRMTSEELANHASVSQPTTSRFCSRLTSGTFPAFKVQLAQQIGVDESQGKRQQADPGATGATPDLTAAEELHRIATFQARQAIDISLQAMSTIDPNALQEAAHLILRARTIVTCGFDLSGSVAWRLASLLRITGLQARHEMDPYGGAYWMDLLGEHDLVIVVSYRGGVPQLHEAIERARKRGVKIMAITNEAQSPLVPLSDFVLLSIAPAARSNDEYTYGDALYVQFAVIRVLWFTLRLIMKAEGRPVPPVPGVEEQA